MPTKAGPPTKSSRSQSHWLAWASRSSNSLYPPPKTPCSPSLNTRSPSAPTNPATLPTDLAELASRYECVNLKLDKTGGFSEGLRLAAEARACGLDLMVGCMIATSLAMAPAVLLAQQARFVDLDGPLLLQKDREHGLRYEGSLLHPPHPQLWG